MLADDKPDPWKTTLPGVDGLVVALGDFRFAPPRPWVSAIAVGCRFAACRHLGDNRRQHARQRRRGTTSPEIQAGPKWH